METKTRARTFVEEVSAIPGGEKIHLCIQCVTCEFGQMMEDALQQRLAKLAARREALCKKEQKATAKA